MKNKFLSAVLFGVLLLPFAGFAQIAMKLDLGRHYYLKYEPVYVTVSLRNDSGHAVAFGNNNRLKGRLLFEIIDSKQRQISAIKGNKYPMEGVLLRPGGTSEIVVPVNHSTTAL